MHLLVITNDFPPRVGGANAYVGELVRRLGPDTATVLTSAWPGDAAFDATFPHRVIRWPVHTLLPTPQVRREAARLVHEERPDLLLFGASLPLALIGVGIRRRLGVPFATFTHGLELGAARVGPGRVFLRRVARAASLITVVSEWARDRLRPVIGDLTRMEVLPSGIDEHTFRLDVSTDVVRSRHALGGGPVVCCVSRLVARKGHDQVIRILPHLADEWPHIRFLVVGPGSYEPRLRRLAARCGVAERVIFTGEVPYADLPAYFRVGDVFAMPCRSRFAGLENEALGAVYLQASAVGRPCIGGRVGGVPEAVRHERTGIVVDGRNAGEVEAAIRQLLHDPSRAEAMGRAGAAWVHGELTWDLLAERLRTMLADCLGPRASATLYSRAFS